MHSMVGAIAQTSVGPIRLVDQSGEAVRVVTQAPSAGGGAWLEVLLWVGLGVLVIGSAVWGAILYGRKTGRADEDAFRTLARRFRLSGRDRELVRTAAGALDVPPLAAVICPSVFDRVFAAFGDDAETRARRERMADRLFGDRRGRAVGSRRWISS